MQRLRIPRSQGIGLPWYSVQGAGNGNRDFVVPAAFEDQSLSLATVLDHIDGVASRGMSYYENIH